MTTPFERLADTLGKVQLLSYTFESKALRFQLFHAGSSRIYSFNLPTDTVHGRTLVREASQAACAIERIALDRRLDIRHERYFPPADSKLLLADARDRVMLAYGRRCSEYRWLVNIRGEYPLLSFLARDLGEIGWDEE